MTKIFEEIAAERKRQDEKWGEQNHPMLPENLTSKACMSEAFYYKDMNDKKDHRMSWLNICLEELYEAFAETDPEKQRAEMIQVAAVAVQIIEYLDRGNR